MAAVRSVFTTEASDTSDENSRASSTIKLPQLQVRRQRDDFFFLCGVAVTLQYVILCDIMSILMLFFLLGSVGAARKVSPDWSHETITFHSFNCSSIVWGQG